MENKMTCINCSVSACMFNHERFCAAKEITVGCNCCANPKSIHETQCDSFIKRG